MSQQSCSPLQTGAEPNPSCMRDVHLYTVCCRRAVFTHGSVRSTHVMLTLLQVITPLLRILEKMHAMKLLHRDIKPENIFLTSLGKFRLGDFGLAIKYDEEVPFSRSGTLDYMAPEVRPCSAHACEQPGLEPPGGVSWYLCGAINCRSSDRQHVARHGGGTCAKRM